MNLCGFRNVVRRRVLPAMLALSLTLSSNGCATLAHRTPYSYEGKEDLTACDREGEVCPWLIGDALWLLVFIIPGVVAFIVDFATGAWRHENFPSEPETPTTPDSEKTEDGT